MLFGLLRWGVEGLWAAALAGFFLHLTVGRSFPWIPAAAAFAGAVLAERTLQGRGWRLGAVLGVHLLGMSACAVWALGGTWPTSGDWTLWAWAVQTTFWVGVLWVKGAACARRPGSHERICSQFDKGVGAFGLIFVIAFVLEVRWNTPSTWEATVYLFFLFFVLSVTAMGMAAPSEQSGRPAPGGAGPGLVLAVLVAGVGGGTILLLMPLLMQGAAWVLEALKTSTSPIGLVLVRLLRFLYARRRAPERHGAPEESEDRLAWPEGGGGEIWGFEQAFGWGLIAVLASVLAAAAGFGLFFAVRALLRRTRAGTPGADMRFPGLHGLFLWLARVRRLSPARWIRALRDPGPVRLFGRLSAWGGRSGLPRRPTETPLEYGDRLGRRFLPLSGEILLITDLVSREAWAETPPGPSERKSGLRAWRRLRSPRWWVDRVRVLLTAPASR